MNPELLIESNSPMMFRVKSIKEEIKPEIQKNGMMLVKRVPSTITDEKNANGRTYSKATVEKAISQAKSRGLFEGRQLLCTGDDHPDTTFPKPINASHICVNAYIEKVDGKNVLFNDWLVLNTTNGQNLRALIEAGSSIGTSIRGLGRQDESTGEITQYEYLGTDVVGNPSAGTFAPFSGKLSECVVESVSETYANTVIENLNLNSQEGTEMFILSEAIESFKAKHPVSEGKTTSEMITDILAIEKEVNFESAEDVEMLEAFKAEILGETPEVAPKEESSAKADSSKTADLSNKNTRLAEEQKLINDALRVQNEELLEQVSRLAQYKESSTKLIASLNTKLQESHDKLVAGMSSLDEEKQTIAEHYREAAVKVVAELQEEAKDIIQETEAKLEASIHFGNLVAEHFFAQQSINDSLTARLEEMTDKGETSKVETKESKLEDTSHKSVQNPHLMSTWRKV